MKYSLSLVSVLCAGVLLAGCEVQKSPTAPLVERAGDAPAAKGGGTGGGGGGESSAKPSSEWTKDEWQSWFFALTARQGQPNATGGAMAALRPYLNAVGADFQNGWRGDYRARIYLPTGYCPPPVSADVPGCSYEKAVDVGENGDGQPWSWVPRF